MTDSSVPPVRTPRLDLTPMTAAFYMACLAGDRAAASRLLGGAAIDEQWWGERGLMEFWLDRLRVDPSLQPWLARAIVRRADGLMVGHIGFHGHPGAEHLNPYAPGGAELGYTVFTAHRRQGYTAEALEALMFWAAREHGVPAFVLSIAPDNVPSRALARRFGFNWAGSQIDPDDGPEDIFVRLAP